MHATALSDHVQYFARIGRVVVTILDNRLVCKCRGIPLQSSLDCVSPDFRLRHADNKKVCVHKVLVSWWLDSHYPGWQSSPKESKKTRGGSKNDTELGDSYYSQEAVRQIHRHHRYPLKGGSRLV